MRMRTMQAKMNNTSSHHAPSHKTGAPMRVFVLLLGVLFLASLYVVFTRSGEMAEKTARFSATDWLHSKPMRAAEDGLNAHIPYRDGAIHSWYAMLKGAFAQGKKDVLIGDGDWLFSEEEYSLPKNHAEHYRAHIAYIAQTVELLAKENIAVMMLPIPSKARLYGAHLPAPLPAARSAVWSNFMRDMAGKNIHHIDMLRVFSDYRNQGHEAFLRTDTHWTPAMAARAAQFGAAGIMQYFPAITATLTPRPTMMLPHNHGTNINDMHHNLHKGDLVAFTETGVFAAWVGPKPEEIAAWKKHTETAPNTEINSADLFAAQTLPITLIGTSYSADERWPFAGFLEEALQSEVWNLADAGTGPFAPMQEFIEKRMWENAGVKLVLWEIPERYLLLPSPVTTPQNEGA